MWVAACLAPALLLFTVVVAYPILSAMAYSLFRWDGIIRGGFAGLANFRRLFGQYPYSARMLTAFWHNVWTFALTMVVQNGLGLLFVVKTDGAGCVEPAGPGGRGRTGRSSSCRSPSRW